MPKSCSPAAGRGGSGCSRVDARVHVLRVCINNHQLVGPHEVDGVINMHSAPWFLRQHPGMLSGLGGLIWCYAQAVNASRSVPSEEAAIPAASGWSGVNI